MLASINASGTLHHKDPFYVPNLQVYTTKTLGWLQGSTAVRWNSIHDRKRWMLTAGAGSTSTGTIPRLRRTGKWPHSCPNSPTCTSAVAVRSDKSTKKKGSSQLETSAWTDSWFMRNGNPRSSDSLTFELKLIQISILRRIIPLKSFS